MTILSLNANDILSCIVDFWYFVSTVMRGIKMNTDHEQFKDEKDTRQGLPDIDSGRPIHETGVSGDQSPDDEVIDLVDVVMKGDSLLDLGTDDLAPLLDKEENSNGAAVIDKKADVDSPELPDALEKETAEDRDDTYESLDFDFEPPEDFEEPQTDTFAGLPQDRDDLAKVVASLEDPSCTDESGAKAISEEPPAISTERLENMITETVKDVVERVTRETMSEVAEKVIKEAIEGLKQSLELPPA